MLGDVLLFLVSTLLLVLLISLFVILTRVLLLGSGSSIITGSLRDLAIEWLWVTKVRHLLVEHVWRNLTIVLVVDANCWHWLWGQILVWVESTKGHNVCQIGDREHWHGILNW